MQTCTEVLTGSKLTQRLQGSEEMMAKSRSGLLFSQLELKWRQQKRFLVVKNGISQIGSRRVQDSLSH